MMVLATNSAWDTHFAISVLPDLLKAFVKVTLVLTVVGSVIAAVVGLIFAVIRRARVPVLSQLVTVFIEFVRSTPIPVQMVFLFYVLPEIGPTLSAMTVAIWTLGLHYACYYAEVYRAGIEGVPTAQWEACRALSLSPLHTWRLVILPQAIRSVLPALGNYVISMFKEVPFVVVLSIPDLVQTATNVGGESFRYVEPLTIAGLIFLAASYPAAVAMRKLEKRLEHP